MHRLACCMLVVLQFLGRCSFLDGKSSTTEDYLKSHGVSIHSQSQGVNKQAKPTAAAATVRTEGKEEKRIKLHERNAGKVTILKEERRKADLDAALKSM